MNTGRDDVMLFDRHERRITCLRISVTGRCNFNCVYCRPEATAHEPFPEVLEYDRIYTIADEAVHCGIRRIKITGGEPLVRPDLDTLIARLAGIPEITELSMTTNGSLLTRKNVQAFRNAGLDRITISLDTLDPLHFASITGGGSLSRVLDGISAARNAGFNKIKINMVIMHDTTSEDVERMRSFCEIRGLQLQTIARFTLGSGNPVENQATDRPPRCEQCNRLRLTCDGFLKPCLKSDEEIAVDMNDIRASLRAAVALKPHSGRTCSNRPMHQIGG